MVLRLALFLATALLPFAGCLPAPKPVSLAPEEEELLRAKGDKELRVLLQGGSEERFAAIGVFSEDAFLGHSAAMEQSNIPILDEFGKAAILLISPGQVLPLLKDPSVRLLRWLGPQGRLARLDPSLELELLSRHSAGTQEKIIDLHVRYKDVPGDTEERQAEAAGFRVVSRSGPSRVVSGPLSGLPKLLEGDRIIYLQKAS